MGPVSEVAVRSLAGPQPGDALQLVSKIEELAAGLCRCGVSEEKALREAAFAVFQAALDDQPRSGWRRSRAAGGRAMGPFEFDQWRQGQFFWPNKRDGPRVIQEARRQRRPTTSVFRRSARTWGWLRDLL
jgi:hypothetical protein